MATTKVGVITLHNSPNYGSCLQAYATQRVIEALGASVEIINYYRKDAIPENETDRALNGQLAKKLPIFKIPGMKALAKKPVERIVRKRRAPLDMFREEYLNLSESRYYSELQLEEDPPVADVYCTGSDQVWNSIWNGGFDPAFYLQFAPEGSQKIAYAASIGKNVIESWERPLIKEALSSYSAISVRENEAAELLEGIGVDGVVPVIDPTLMLSREEWRALSDGSAPSTPYILVYQLNKSPEFDRYISQISKKMGLPVYRLGYGVHERRKGERLVACPTLNAFISYFLNAELVLTDSFHGTAFSINLKKRFIAVSPGRFSGRINNLLKMVGATERYVGEDFNDFSLLEEPIDFQRCDSELDVERDKATAFLVDALGHSLKS